MRKEKYITEIKNGKYHYLKIQIRMKDGKNWTKTSMSVTTLPQRWQ